MASTVSSAVARWWRLSTIAVLVMAHCVYGLQQRHVLSRQTITPRSRAAPRSPTKPGTGDSTLGETISSSSTAPATPVRPEHAWLGRRLRRSSPRRLPLRNSTPIRIAGADEASVWAPGNENAWATGWGPSPPVVRGAHALREVNIDRIADSTCAAPSSYGSTFSSRDDGLRR